MARAIESAPGTGTLPGRQRKIWATIRALPLSGTSLALKRSIASAIPASAPFSAWDPPREWPVTRDSEQIPSMVADTSAVITSRVSIAAARAMPR